MARLASQGHLFAQVRSSYAVSGAASRWLAYWFRLCREWQQSQHASSFKGVRNALAPSNVNPVLVLLTVACNDRWEEGVEQAVLHFHQQKAAKRQQCQSQGYASQLRQI